MHVYLLTPAFCAGNVCVCVLSENAKREGESTKTGAGTRNAKAAKPSKATYSFQRDGKSRFGSTKV